MDVLGDVLAVARVDASLLATFDAQSPWGIDLPTRSGASFHTVISGTCWLSVEGTPLLQLVPGDLILLPQGTRHVLTAEPGLPTRLFDDELKRDLITPEGELVITGLGARTRILCAGYGYDTDIAHPVLSLLPSVLHVSTSHPSSGPWLRGVIDLLAHETGSGQRGTDGIGSSTAAARLLDLLLIHVVRAWLSQADGGVDASVGATALANSAGSADHPSWLTGLRDPLTARALGALHAEPSRAWTLETLAASVHVSRATLARRFTEHVGEPPLAYLARWRMELAAQQLRETAWPVAVVAHGVGYTSEFAFNRAFARRHGCPPGRYRRQHADRRSAAQPREVPGGADSNV
jgi:AraC-like DNA-binding protein